VSVGRDDPAISQQGFDDGYPVGAGLALAVGRILATLSERVKTGPGVDTKQRLAEAKEELGIEKLVEEMRTCGVLRDVGGQHEESVETLSVEDGFVDRLPSVRKWMRIIQELVPPGRQG